MASILLVEDEPLVCETLSSAMKSKGHTVITAANGLEGLKRFTERTFDLTVTDIIMPDKEGIEMIREMRRQRRRSLRFQVAVELETSSFEDGEKVRCHGDPAETHTACRISDGLERQPWRPRRR